ncbi:tetratricopeptide repeat protein [Salinibacter altiplanensis]|uniref:tetratricopeptide repeat protein n=1 Tax=Salinibacter altiplanensis TaxID=1803181 RepID=UPI0012FFD6AB|nr:tetratricopeptide repeat protein [Salinibacter altiplanensis]
MAALKTPEKTSRRQELRQNILVDLYARTLLFYDEYKRFAQGLGVALLVLILAIPGYIYYYQQQAEAANQQLGQILPVYEQGNYQQALDGTGDRAGLLTIADDYGGTSAGNLATFYAANALYQREEYDRALAHYQRFEKDQDFIGASAYAAQAAIQETQGAFERAASLYEQAASQYQNELTAPRYLLRAGQAYEEAGQYEAAVGMYEKIQDEYPDADQVRTAEQYLSRAKVRRGSTSSS